MSNLIVIDITEWEKILLDGELKQKEISGKGKLLVKNPSEKSRLWNLLLDLREIVNTNLQKEQNVGELNSGQEYDKDYEVQALKTSYLQINEIFDTDREISDTVNNTFLYKEVNKCSLKLTLKNTLDLPILNIKVIREIPAFFQDIEIKPPSVGSAQIKEEDGKTILSWEIPSLNNQQNTELDLTFAALMNERTDQALGALNITYLANNHKLTMLNPEITGLTDSMSGIDRGESSKPGTWDCNVEFINESDFQVKLESVKVAQKIPTGMETVVSQTPDKVLGPDLSWDFDFNVESKDVPELESTIEFTTLYTVITRVYGEIIKDSTIYPVISAEISKDINPPEVGAYANTEMTIENTIVNKGSAYIQDLTIIDEIPADFVPPEIGTTKLTLLSSDGAIDVSRQEYMQSFTISPNDRNLDSLHKLEIKLSNLKDLLKTDIQLKMNYPLLAKNPKPEDLYKTPVIIEALPIVKGKKFKITPSEEPEIKIKYIKRQLKTLKSIKPAGTEGSFNISLRIQNKGDVELENIIVKDKIPSGFSLSSLDPKDLSKEVVSVGGESELQVKIPELAANSALKIDYVCTGQGEYPRSEPQVVVKGRSGVEDTDKPAAETESNPTKDLAEQSVGLKKGGELFDLFSKIYQKIDEGVTGLQIGELIESNVDVLPLGPIRHQFMAYARELKSNVKTLVGEMKESVINKLNEYKEKYKG